MTRVRLSLSASLFALGCGISCGISAQAQMAAPANQSGDALEEVVVTAEHRSVDLQKSALAVTAISGDDIATHGDSTVSDVLMSVPGVQIQGIEGGMSALSVTGGGGPPNISIRGLGTDGPNRSSSTAVYADDVLLTGGGGEFYDINRVEVLRGPQGTLWGRGATGGAVNIITNDPTMSYHAMGQLQYGSDQHESVQAMGNIPLSDNLATRVAVNQIRHDGYLSNGQDDENDVNARVKVLYKPNEDFSLLVGGTYYHANENGGGFVVFPNGETNPTSWNTSWRSGGAFDRIDYKKIYAKLDWDLGFAQFTYIPAYQTTNSKDQQYGGIEKEQTVAPFDRTTTQEARLSNPAGSLLTWVAGLYYYRNENEQIFSTGPAPLVNPPVVVTEIPTQASYAAFGDATYPLTDSLRVTAGLRETFDHLQATDTFPPPPGGSVGATDISNQYFKHFDWKARVDGDLSATSLLYGMVSTGYRPGGFANGLTYGNESVTAYEIGSKSRFDNRYTLDVSAFYYDYSGFQSLQSETVNNVVQSTVISLPATFYGLDVEFGARLTEHDRIRIAPEILKGTWGADLPYTPTGGTATTIATSGKTVPHVPLFSVSGSYAHTVDLANGAELTGNVGLRFQTQQLTDFDVSNYPATNPYFKQGAYALVDASLTYMAASGDYRVTLYGKNLSNVIYKITTQQSFGTWETTVNEPRAVGVILRGEF